MMAIAPASEVWGQTEWENRISSRVGTDIALKKKKKKGKSSAFFISVTYLLMFLWVTEANKIGECSHLFLKLSKCILKKVSTISFFVLSYVCMMVPTCPLSIGCLQLFCSVIMRGTGWWNFSSTTYCIILVVILYHLLVCCRDPPPWV